MAPSSARHPRVALFTDTLGDVNGVSRFLNDIVDQAIATERPLQVLTSTRFTTRPLPTIHNVPPLFACPMPGYPQLELAVPNVRALLQRVRAIEPDVIHVSTPGPVGLVGVLASRLLRLPLVGTYHTDFPAYIADLFDDDPTFNAVARAAMRGIYRRFDTIFTRSEDYAHRLRELGVKSRSMPRLRPGIRLDRFSPSFHDPAVWKSFGVSSASIKFLYVGRLSVEKNMPMLVRVWHAAQTVFRARGTVADLILVGDGPYRDVMQSDLPDAHFLGFRHGTELSTIYASSDIFLFPSMTDTLGQVVMEAQASGLPAIVTNIGGPKEIVRHGCTGFVLSPNDPHAWSATIEELTADPKRLESMANAANKHMRSFSIGASFDHFWQVHESVWRQSCPPHPLTSLQEPAAAPSATHEAAH